MPPVLEDGEPRAGGGEQTAGLLASLRRAGCRITTPRRLLVEVLVESEGHRTAEALATEVQRRAPEVHLSTVYRNLEELEHLGVIEHAHLGQSAATYHLASERHGHLVCSECGAIIEIPDDVLAQLQHVASATYGFLIDPHQSALRGRCATCAARAPDPAAR